ncbi:hypothetical protein GGD81_004415 [Rhodobium orientis]|uniref:Uncharacterized protein n=1 Tax=Rhodobium orientis TaxID=34017 RepID=A0A327JGM2_9HYPH|nr:hypothetical protein [Rhodobium orientis]MBB4305340.1 hypothetical protein [Rhodobium orientis]MBK5949935.1 hypothetical protein [Rhodobium orientis]RAI25550.1 hypothetical protein CH339_17705 [Rhodobium orientis]
MNVVNPHRRTTVVGQCTRIGATSTDMYAAGCGPISADRNPTHTIIFAGIATQPCQQHPNGANYWRMAENLVWAVNW